MFYKGIAYRIRGGVRKMPDAFTLKFHIVKKRKVVV